MKWVEEEGSFDVLSSKKIKCTGDILDVDEGDRVEGQFKGKYYPVGILARGLFVHVKCVV